MGRLVLPATIVLCTSWAASAAGTATVELRLMPYDGLVPSHFTEYFSNRDPDRNVRLFDAKLLDCSKGMQALPIPTVSGKGLSFGFDKGYVTYDDGTRHVNMRMVRNDWPPAVTVLKNGMPYFVNVETVEWKKKDIYVSQGTMLAGRKGRTTIALVDLNWNGKLDEVGEDGVIIGNGMAARLTRHLFIDGRAYSWELSMPEPKRGKAELKLALLDPQPDLGIVGLNAYCAKRVTAMVVTSDEYSFDLGAMKKSRKIEIPVGTYHIEGAQFKPDVKGYLAKAGTAEKTFTVEAAGTVQVPYGEPYLEFEAEYQDGEIRIGLYKIYVWGAGREPYLYPEHPPTPLVFIGEELSRRPIGKVPCH